MTTELDMKEFGGMIENVKTLVLTQAETKADLRKSTEVLFGKIDDLQEDVTFLKTNGCVIGRQHALDIKALQDKPANFMRLIAVVIAIVTPIIGGLIWLATHVEF